MALVPRGAGLCAAQPRPGGVWGRVRALVGVLLSTLRAGTRRCPEQPLGREEREEGQTALSGGRLFLRSQCLLFMLSLAKFHGWCLSPRSRWRLWPSRAGSCSAQRGGSILPRRRPHFAERGLSHRKAT